jgi:hypothetical protein
VAAFGYTASSSAFRIAIEADTASGGNAMYVFALPQ